MRRSSRHLWLVCAAILLGLGAWLANPADQAQNAPRKSVEFPNYPRRHEYERMATRETLPARAPQIMWDNAEEEETPRSVRDPLLRALPPKEADSLVIFEANALRHSVMGELMVDCLTRTWNNPIQNIYNYTGIDVLSDLDRLVVLDEGMIVTGSFEEIDFDQLFGGMQAKPYGDEALIYAADEESPLAIGIWRNEMLFMGETREEITRAVDRIEGRAVYAPPMLENQAYGEVYGTMHPKVISEIIAHGSPEIAKKIAAIVEGVDIHIDAMNDVAMVATMRGSDENDIRDLAKTIGVAFSVGRLAARANGDEVLEEILDYAKVSPSGNVPWFDLELALPQAVIEDYLAEACGEIEALEREREEALEQESEESADQLDEE